MAPERARPAYGTFLQSRWRMAIDRETVRCLEKERRPRPCNEALEKPRYRCGVHPGEG